MNKRELRQILEELKNTADELESQATYCDYLDEAVHHLNNAICFIELEIDKK